MAAAARVVEDFPKDPHARALLATAHYNHGNSTEALRNFERCLELDPTLADVYTMMGRVALERGELNRAVTLCRQALKTDPRMPDAWYHLGRALLDLGRMDEAIATMREAITACGRSSARYYLLGQGYMLSKQYEKAKESFMAATETDPGHTQAYFGLFTVCSRLGQREKAAEYRQRFCQLEAVDAQALTDLNRRQAKLGGLPSVRQWVARTSTGAGQVYRKHGRFLNAEKLWRRAATLDPSNWVCRGELLMLYRLQNRAEVAQKLFKQLAETQPGNGVNYCFLGAVRALLGRHDAAEEAYRKAVELSPREPGGYRALAELFLATGRRLPEAKSLASKLVELKPVAPHYFLLAKACARNGDRAGARAAIRRAIELGPGQAEYEQLRKRIEEE